MLNKSIALIALPLLIVFLIQNVLYKLVGPSIQRGRISRPVYYLSSLVGTPIHELSHYVGCLLFFHKVTGIKLFPTSTTGTLGYVLHSWNTRSIYQSIGCFFIAVAPMVTAITVTYFLLNNYRVTFHSNSLVDLLGNAADLSWHIVSQLTQTWAGIGKLLLVSLICFHCVPSNGDFKNAAKGSVITLALLALGVYGMQFFDVNDAGLLDALCLSVILMFSAYIISVAWWVILWLLSFL